MLFWLRSALFFTPRHYHHEGGAAAVMANDGTISTIALAVALVALITTISQCLGQFLATADGYRRCQASVMGGWAKMTHRRFRWSEMRFETLYTTPLFGLSQRNDLTDSKKTPRYYLDGSLDAMKKTYCGRNVQLADTTSLVSWVRLVEALHISTRETLRYSDFNRSSIPNVMLQRRSWDFVPPEVVRPLAMVTISDIAILARRLGMIWKQFEPLDGNLRAEGNGHTITSTAVRSMGTVLQIGIRDHLPVSYQEKSGEYIPSRWADMMGFGIVPGEIYLFLPEYKLGTEEEVLSTLRNVVDPGGQAADRVKGILGANPGWTPAISDIIGFASPMIHQHGSSLIRVPQPAGYAVGLTQQQEGFVVFHNRLKDLVTERDAKGEHVTAQTRLILEQYEQLLDRYGDKWEDQETCNKENRFRSVEFLNDLHTMHDNTTRYFQTLTLPQKSIFFRYTDLMYSHIRHAVNYFPEALERINASPSRARNHYGMRVAGWITEGAHIYFDNIPKIVNDMRDRGFDKHEIVEEAWLTMMFRAFLWHRCHFMVEGPRVPSSHWASNLPVFIG